jgi:hypothetical protein
MIDGAAAAALAISTFGLFATIMENYVISEAASNPWYNLQENATVFNQLVEAIWNLHLAVFTPLFPRGLFLFIPAFDAYALTYFSLLLLSMCVLRRKLGLIDSLLQCTLIGSSILVFYELGLALVSPGYLSMHVTNVQLQLGMAWFTNLDLLAISAVLIVALLVARFLLRVPLRVFSRE